MELSPGTPWSESYEHDDPVLSSMYFRAGSKNRVYSHDPYKFLDFLGDIGGFLEIGYAFGLVLTMSFVKDSFMRSILSDTYQVQNYAENNSEFYVSGRVRKQLAI